MSTKKAYVVGTNVSKSLSPTIFNYWFYKYNISGEYNYKEIKEELFDEKIKTLLKEENLCGLNVTMPFKEKIISHLTKTDEYATKINAVNCVTIKANSFEGTNTDWIGFQNSLEAFEEKHQNNSFGTGEEKTKIGKNIAIVIGYGGSARAIIHSLILKGYKKIKVFNRSFEKIKKTKIISAYELKEFDKHADLADIIINTIPTEFFRKSAHTNNRLSTKNSHQAFGYDLVYTNENRFLQRFLPPNRIYGTSMLVYQAAPCFHLWFGVKPKIDSEIFEILIKKLKQNR